MIEFGILGVDFCFVFFDLFLLDNFHLTGKSGLVSCTPRLRWGDVVDPEVGFESVGVKYSMLVFPYTRSESGGERLVKHSGG